MSKYQVVSALAAALVLSAAVQGAPNSPKAPAPIIIVPQGTIPWMQWTGSFDSSIAWASSDAALIGVRLTLPASLLANSSLSLDPFQARAIAQLPSTLTQAQLVNQGAPAYSLIAGVDTNPFGSTAPAGRIDVFFQMSALNLPGTGIGVALGQTTTFAVGVPIYRTVGGVRTSTGYWLVASGMVVS